LRRQAFAFLPPQEKYDENQVFRFNWPSWFRCYIEAKVLEGRQGE